MYKFLSFFTALLFLTISFSSPVEAAYQSGAGTQVKANIPSKVDIRIYGYTAPYAIVQATSIRVFAQVSSDKTGYFIIDPLPVSQEAREICLTTIDAQKRYGFPLCVNLPDTDKPTEIGPLLLSPTISLTGSNLTQGTKIQAQATGQTLPNANLEISFFDNESTNKKLSDLLIPKAYAKTIPKLTTKTDKNGNYSINLPTNKAVAYRLFTKSFFSPAGAGTGLPTPKSQTLTFSVLSYTDYWLRNILPKWILLFLLAILLAIFVFVEIKTGQGRRYLARINETKLKPFGVRSRLAMKRLSYNLRGYLRSHQI